MIVGIILLAFIWMLIIVVILAALPNRMKPWYRISEMRRFRKDLKRL